MKKIISTILGITCLSAMILCGAEKADGSCDILWSLMWLSIAVVCGFGFAKLNPRRTGR